MAYKIGSFNIRDFGMDVTKKDLCVISQIIKKDSFDIIAIQEITNKFALWALLEQMSCEFVKEERLNKNKKIDCTSVNRLTTQLYRYRTKHWEGVWAKPLRYYGINSEEGYAYIWNRDRIKLVTNKENKEFQPRISDYKGSDKLARPPLLARFMPINGNYEFRLINTHIVYSKPASLKKDNCFDNYSDVTEIELRAKELYTLLDSVYYQFANEVYDITGNDKKARYMIPYTFLMGDYNLNLDILRAKDKKAQVPQELAFYRKDNMNIITVNSELTTLSDYKNNNLVLERNPLSNNFDHFSYDLNILKKHQIQQPQVGVINAFTNYNETNEESKYEQYNKRVSDHLPIYVDFDIRKTKI